LANINEVNNRKLGGQEPKNPSMDEEEQQFQSMEEIMGKFSNFSSNRQSMQNDDDDDEEADEFDSNTGSMDAGKQENSGIIEVDIDDQP
jgi:hypothetical protein